MDSNIDMKDTYRILNLKAPLDVDEPATKSYTDNNFLKTNGTKPMTHDLSLGSYRITHLVILQVMVMQLQKNTLTIWLTQN